MNATHETRSSLSPKTTQAQGAALLALLLLTGCARFHTTQTDNRYENGKMVGSIVTKVSSFTLFSSKSQMANFQASQTEKSQGAKVGALSMQGATNTAGSISEMTNLMREINRLKSPIPFP